MNQVSESLGKLLIEMLMREGYNFMSTENKNLLVTYISGVNDVPLTDITKEYLFNMQKETKIKELSEICEATIMKGSIAPNGNFYRMNRDDQINMIGQKDLLDNDDSIVEVMWKTEDSGYISHAREDWLRVYYSLLSFKSVQLFRFNYLKSLVSEAKDEGEILSVYWDMTTPYDTPPVVETPVEEGAVEDGSVDAPVEDVTEGENTGTEEPVETETETPVDTDTPVETETETV